MKKFLLLPSALCPLTFYFVFLANCLLPTAFITLSGVEGFSQGTWTQKADFGGSGRNLAVGFSIGIKGYIGLGGDTLGNLKNDFWEWDQNTNIWSQKAICPGTGTSMGFSIGTKGYIFGGNGSIFWEWDQISNSWLQKNNFTGTPRKFAVAFSIGTMGYMSTGVSGTFPNLIYYNDCWEYDPPTDTWTQKASLPGIARYYSVGFSIGNKGCVGTGTNNSFGNPVDFWEYDQATNTWTQITSFSTLRGGAVGFSIGTKGYIGTGNDFGGDKKDFWEWNQSTNVWTEQTNFGGTARSGAVGFSIGTKGYIGTGSYYYYRDFWEFDPNGNNITENEFENSISVYPNPTKGKFKIQMENEQLTIDNYQTSIYNSQGEKVYAINKNKLSIINSPLSIDLSSQPSGVYFIHISSGDKTAIKRVVISN